MIKKQSVFIFVAFLLLAIGCTANSSKESMATKKVDINTRISNIEKEIHAMLEHAEAARKKAASVGGEWRDIGKFIKNAKKALANGKYEKAINLAKKAARQGELGYQQMMNQKDNYMPGYFKF